MLEIISELNKTDILVLLFSAWFLVFILISLIKTSSVFSVIYKAEDTQAIKDRFKEFPKTTEDWLKENNSFDEYCKAKNLNVNNIVVSVLKTMYKDGRSGIQHMPDKYINTVRAKINRIMLNKYIMLVLIIPVYLSILDSRKESMTDIAFPLVSFFALSVMCILFFKKYMEKIIERFSLKLYSVWYDDFCNLEKIWYNNFCKIQSNMSNARKYTAHKAKKLNNDREFYVKHTSKMTKELETLNMSLISINEQMAKREQYDYKKIYGEVEATIDKTNELSERYRSFETDFQNRMKELNKTIKSSSNLWENAETIGMSLGGINERLTEMNQKSNIAVVATLERMEKNVTNSVRETLDSVNETINQNSAKLQKDFENFAILCNAYIKKIEGDPDAKLIETIKSSQKTMLSHMSSISERNRKFETVISEFISVSKQIAEMLAEKQRWETTPNFIEKLKHKSDYKKLLDHEAEKVNTYDKILEMYDKVDELKENIEEHLPIM